MANASFALGMVAPIPDKLTAMKAGRYKANHGLPPRGIPERSIKLDLRDLEAPCVLRC